MTCFCVKCLPSPADRPLETIRADARKAWATGDRDLFGAFAVELILTSATCVKDQPEAGAS